MKPPVESSPQPEPLSRSFRPYRGIVGRLLRLTLKELRETLRDRRTIVTLVAMPLLIYPLLSVAFQRFLLTNLRPESEVVYRIGVESERDAILLKQYLSQGQSEYERERTVITKQTQNPDSPVELTEEEEFDLSSGSGDPILEYFKHTGLERAVEQSEVDIAIRVSRVERIEESGPTPLSINYQLISLNNSLHSNDAAEYVKKLFRAVNEKYLHWKLNQQGFQKRLMLTRAEYKIVGTEGEVAALSLSTLVPLILILMTITGAVYPAIDLTAGERERGTLEILISAPVPRMGLLLAKYTAVLVVALLTATVNLTAMTITILSIGLGPHIFGELGLSFSVIVQIFALLLLFAMFFSALLLSVTSFARSFKEAQAYLIPLMLVSLAPGMLSMVPTLSLTNPETNQTSLLAVAPLVNIVLLARDLFSDAVDSTSAAIVILSTVGYALLAIAVAAKTFGSDAILYGSRGSWSDLFRRPAERKTVPGVANAFLCLMLMLPGFVLSGSFMARLQDVSLGWRLGLSGLITALLCGLVPLVFAVMNHIRLPDGFQLKPARPVAFLGAVLLGVSLWPFAHEIVLLSRGFGLVSLNEDLMKLAQKLVAELRSESFLLVLIGLAVIPALFEEFFFRGYLLGALQARTGATRAVLISAVCFGLFHVVARDVLAIERLLPSTFLGVVLGWVCVRSGSVFPGMILHACNNGVILAVSHFQERLLEYGLGAEEREHIPASWLMTAAVIALAGAAVMVFTVRSGGLPSRRTATPA